MGSGKRFVVDLADLGDNTLSLDGAFAPGDIDFSNDELRQAGELKWSGTLEEKGSGARFAGLLAADIDLTCVRCVEPIRERVERKFDLFFERNEEELYTDSDEVELDSADTSTAFIVGTELALDEVMHEQVLLAVPMKPLCAPDCKGLCSTCGANLNQGECDCQPATGHPAFESLAEFRKQLEKSGRSGD